MGAVMEEEIKRWTIRCKSALVLEIIQDRTTVAQASCQFDLMPTGVENGRGWSARHGKRFAGQAGGWEQYERQDRQETYGEAMLELACPKKAGNAAGQGHELMASIQQG